MTPQSNAAAVPELADPMAPHMRMQRQLMEDACYQNALLTQPFPEYWCTIAYHECDQQVELMR